MNPDCTVCHGTGEDPDFGGKCSMCEGFIPRRGGIGEVLQERRKNNSGAAQKSSSTVAKDKSWTLRPRWTRQGDTFFVVTPRVMREVRTGDTVTVHKADGTTSEVTLGEWYDKNDFGDSLWYEAPRPLVQQTLIPNTGLDLRSIPSGRYAVPGGTSRLKVEIDVVEKGKWAGWVFVKDAAVYGEGQRYGRQKPGQTYEGKIEKELRIIAADPVAASAAYGRLTDRCGFCNRPLEAKKSVARAIGPDCYAKYFGG